MIAISSMVYTYPRTGFVLSCPSLQLPAGKMTLITGPNGSGKTTLANLICGILKPHQGEISIFGRPSHQLSLGEIGSRIGYLMQNPARQLFACTVMEEMLLVPEILGEDFTSAAARADQLLTRFDLAALKDQSIYRLSRGEKQRLALCTLLLSGPDFFVLDEPTTGLDAENRARLYQIMDELMEKGIGLAVISHDPELLSRRDCQKVRLEGGKVLP